MGKIEMIQRNSQKVFGLCQRGRKIMVIGRQDYTSPGSCSLQSVYAVCRNIQEPYGLVDSPSHIVNSAGCRDLIKDSPGHGSIHGDRAVCRNMPDAGCLVSIPW